MVKRARVFRKSHHVDFNPSCYLTQQRGSPTLDPRQTKMILTNCAACAAPLPHKAKQCSRCKTRYCGPACQKKHWDEGGHDALCKKIKKGGGAEQYHADKKYKEAVAEAVEACADDTKLDDGTLIYAPEDTDSYIREFNFNPYSRHRDWNRNVSSK